MADRSTQQSMQECINHVSACNMSPKMVGDRVAALCTE